VCGRGQRIDGDHCVSIAREARFVLGGDGTCQKRKEPRQNPVARETAHPPTQGGGKCFIFNGKRFCE